MSSNNMELKRRHTRRNIISNIIGKEFGERKLVSTCFQQCVFLCNIIKEKERVLKA